MSPARDPGATHPPDEPAAGLRKAAILVVSLDETLAGRVLAHLDRPAVEAVTLEMARLDRIDAEEQRTVLEEFFALGRSRLQFSFEDLPRLDDTDIREAFHEEDLSAWTLALAGTSRPVRAKVLGALPPATAEHLRGRLARLGPYRLDDAETAQTELAERLRRLHDHGRITLPDPDGQEDVLV